MTMKTRDTKRLNVNLPEETYDELRDLADSSCRSMTDLVRTALALAKIALEEERKHNRLAVTDESGEVIKQLVIAQ